MSEAPEGSADYDLYGLRLRSSRPLPHLVPVRHGAGEQVDVWLEIRDVGFARGPEGKHLRLRLEGVHGALEFDIDPAGGQVSAGWAEGTTVKLVDDVTSLLVGRVAACVLRLRGRVCLHGCAVEVGSRAVVLLGEPGTGKSTTAAALAKTGHPVLSDDVAALAEPGRAGDPWLVEPGYPRLRLAPAAIEGLGAPADRLWPVLTGTEKRYVELATDGPARTWRFAPSPSPLASIYVLERSPAPESAIIEPITGGAALTTLIGHTSGRLAPLDKPMREQELARLARLAAAVPLRRLRYPHGLDQLPMVCDAIAADVKARLQVPA